MLWEKHAMFEQHSERTLRQTQADVQESRTLTVYGLFRQGLTVREVTMLIAARQRHTAGELTEWPGEFHRLCFARWLYDQGIIGG